MPAEYFLEAAGNAGDALEGRGIDGVHADGDAVESGVFERRGQGIEQMAVGGEREVERARRMECASRPVPGSARSGRGEATARRR